MEAGGAGQGMRGSEHKVLTKTLREAVEQLERKAGDLANVFAIVDECTLPKQSRGSDYFVRMNLYDESTSSSGWERPRLIELMVFSKQLHKLPTSVVPKSIIRLQNVKIQWYNKDVGQEAVRKPQLCGRVGLGFQYQLFHHSEGSNSNAPFMTADASNLKVTAADKERLAQLRQYSIKLQLKDMAPLADASQTYLRKVFELWTVAASPTPLLVDVICQILAIDKRLHPLTVVHVWDGTDLPPVSERSSSGQVANPHTTLPQRRHALPLLSSAAGVEVCQQLPQLGTAVPLLLSRNSALPEVGSWVKVKCVSTITVQGQLQLLEHERTQIAERTTTVGTWLSNYDERVKNNQVSQPTPLAFQSSCVCSSDLQPQTVRQLLQSVHAGIPGVFRLHARVVRYHPQDLAHALVPLEELWLPQQECTGAALACGHTFAIKLLLEDATGQVDAVLLGRDAEQFFQGLPPFPPNRPDQVSKLQEWLSLLAQNPAQAAAGPSGDGSDAGGGAWLDCCVKLAFLDQGVVVKETHAYGRMRRCLLAAALTRIDTAVQGNRAAAPQARTLALPPKAAQRRATACCANGAHEELHDLEVAAYHHGMQTVASLAQPVARQCYGGPPPFGLGLGLARHLEQLSWLQPLPHVKEQVQQQRRQQRHQLIQLARNFNAPLDHLDEELKERVMQARLKLLLGKFWGLMHEADRPWHYDTVVYLCCQLPKPARQLYRSLKPPTLQRILAKRAQVEKGLKDCLNTLQRQLQRLNKWEYQVLELGAVVPDARLEETARVILLLQDQLATLMALLHSLRRQAWQLHDQDYTQYGAGLQQLALECRQLCRHLQRKRMPYVREASSVNAQFQQQPSSASRAWPGEGKRLTAMASLGAVPMPGLLPSAHHITWRYPPQQI